MKLTAYINREDREKTEEEEFNNFFRTILTNIGLEINEIWAEDAPMTTELKRSLREYLAKFNVEVVYDGDHGYKIYVEDDVVGEWKKPTYILRTDVKARQLSKKFYYEVTYEFVSVFDTEEMEDGRE